MPPAVPAPPAPPAAPAPPAPPAASAPSLRPVLCLSAASRLRGLLYRRPGWLAADEVLVLAPCASIHTFLMRDAIDVAFIDARGRVLRSERAVPPGRMLTAPRAACVLERFTPESNDGCWPAAGDTLALCTGELQPVPAPRLASDSQPTPAPRLASDPQPTPAPQPASDPRIAPAREPRQLHTQVRN